MSISIESANLMETQRQLRQPANCDNAKSEDNKSGTFINYEILREMFSTETLNKIRDKVNAKLKGGGWGNKIITESGDVLPTDESIPAEYAEHRYNVNHRRTAENKTDYFSVDINISTGTGSNMQAIRGDNIDVAKLYADIDTIFPHEGWTVKINVNRVSKA